MPGRFYLVFDLCTAQRSCHYLPAHWLIAKRAGENVLLLVTDQRFPDDLHRQIRERLLDHPAFFDPLERNLKARVLTIEVEQFVAVRGQQFAGAQHGDQFEFEGEAGLAIPRQVGPVEAVPENLDFLLGQDARARMLPGPTSAG